VPLCCGITADRSAAHTPCELPRSLRCSSDDRTDVVERHVEHVVQHERNALARRKRIEQNRQRNTDRIGKDRFFLRAFSGSDGGSSAA
jgi:hypothetical protein